MQPAPFTIECIYSVPVEKVWKAITDKAQMKEWYFDISEFKPEAGFGFQFTGQGHDGDKYIHLCRITHAEPHKKLRYSWSYQGMDGISYVTFELFPEGESSTRLRLTHEGIESFQQTGNRDFAPESFAGGWTYITGTALKGFLEKTTS
ncbi:MAG TPA: SRPBCC domain-containing protein [Chitinophagaceae bacterium]|nr:SRPBCC domain-containing protein [Chitinophagaceae bacterium]